MKTRTGFLVTCSAALAISGCAGGSSSGGSPAASSAAPTPAATSATPSHTVEAWNPTITPADFSATITHPYFPLKPGTTKIFEGTRDGKPFKAEVVVTNRTRTVMGVECAVIEDTVTTNGALAEKTEDWYAQKKDGSVWYFGENTAEYTNGAVSSTHGTWEAGVDGAKPGVIMHASPRVGTEYYQEFRPGEAEDRARILSLKATIKVPAGSFTNVVTTEDSDPLNPNKTDKKWYAKGIGTVHYVRIKSATSSETMSLSKVTQG